MAKKRNPKSNSWLWERVLTIWSKKNTKKCPIKKDLVQDIVLEVKVADCRKVARRNAFQIDSSEEDRRV
jgi:hypothetical protein